MPEELFIESITIEGFRGFNTAQTINFDGSHVVISGPMGTGKSSTLCAIEWALFGDIAHLKCSESRTQAEFVNANKVDQKAIVTLKMKGDDGEYVIQREKYAETRGSDLTFTTPMRKFEGDEAANQIYSIFGTFEDFHRSVFLHQEAIRTILTEDPEERDSGLDRLFGLERTRELMSAIPVGLAREECQNLENEKTKIEERIKGATHQAEVEMDRAKKEAFGLGLKTQEFNLRACRERFSTIIKSITRAAEDCGIEKPSFSEPATLEDFSKGLKKVKEVIRGCRMYIAATSKLGELQKYQTQINMAKEQLKYVLAKLQEAHRECRELQKAWGTIEEIQKLENKLKTRDENLKEEREAVDSTSRLVADGIEVLSNQQFKRCPICGAKISPEEVLSKLRTKVSIALEKRLLEIDDERSEIREKLLQLKDIKGTISKAISTVERLESARNQAEKALGEVLKSKSKGSKILLREAENKLAELQEKLAREERALSKKSEVLQTIEDSVESCRAIVQVLEKEAEYEKIRETFAVEDSQIRILKSQITEMAALYARLKRISEAIAKVQVNLASEFVSKGEKKISDYYSRLCGHPYYDTIRIDTGQRNVRGVQKNTYNIRAFNKKDGRQTLVSTRFSAGQMNCAALSIFLSLSSMLDRKIKFVILDDPSQSLDRDHKRALVKVLNDVAIGNQVVVATQDTELEQEIQRGFVPRGGYISLKYKGWNKEGPTFEISRKMRAK